MAKLTSPFNQIKTSEKLLAAIVLMSLSILIVHLPALPAESRDITWLAGTVYMLVCA